MTFRPLLVLALLLATTSAWAQKPVERSALEIGTDYIEATYANSDGVFVRTADGTPHQLSRLDYPVTGDTPVAMARQYLTGQAASLRLADASTLAHHTTRSGLSGHTVRFTQMVGDVPVYGAETVVNIDRQNRVQLVVNGSKANVVIDTTPTLDGPAARQLAFDHLGVTGDLLLDETELMVYPMADGARLAWRVRVVPGYGEPNGDWETFVDARTGELLRVAERTLYHGEEDEDTENPPALMAPTAASHRAMMRVDGTAFVFDPDPLTRTGSTYGQPGYVDGNDADTPELTAARVMVNLPNILFDGTDYHFEGDYAAIRELESPNQGLFEQPSADWDDTRLAPGFEGATVYYLIDTYMRYINEDLGISVMPFQYSGGVRFDAHGLNGADNSHYTGAGIVAFGEGCVDDSEDGDVIIHELGHGLHDWLTSGGLSNFEGLSEGFGDYVAVSYTRGLGLLAPTDPEYNWVFKWDGHNPCWGGRITNYGATYPTGSAPHTRGQHWSTSNLKIWEDLGRERTDAAVFEGLAMTSSSTTQPQAAQAVLQAAANMGYTNAELTMMAGHYTTQGYSVTVPTPTANEGNGPDEQLARFELTSAYPNPFGPAANFTLRVAEAQHVSIALFDALGRQVQVIFEGEMAAGERRVLTIDAAGLPSGLYIYRALGEGVSASQRVVLNK